MGLFAREAVAFTTSGGPSGSCVTVAEQSRRHPGPSTRMTPSSQQASHPASQLQNSQPYSPGSEKVRDQLTTPVRGTPSTIQNSLPRLRSHCEGGPLNSTRSGAVPQRGEAVAPHSPPRAPRTPRNGPMIARVQIVADQTPVADEFMLPPSDDRTAPNKARATAARRTPAMRARVLAPLFLTRETSLPTRSRSLHLGATHGRRAPSQVTAKRSPADFTGEPRMDDAPRYVPPQECQTE